MTELPSRRDVLRLAGLAGVAAVASACTGSSAKRAPSSPAATASAASPRLASPASSSSSAPRPTFAALSKQLKGRLARPGDTAYRPKTLLYNPRFAGRYHPQAIARCANHDDVVACVRFAAEGGSSLRIRNGGHSYGGWSSGPGLVVDLAALNSVQVDRSAKTATIGAGGLLENVYASLADQGASIGSGSCATVGISGITLGGGVGLLTKLYGLTCDQLRAATIVTADGTTLTVSATEHDDLFWALRGGGGSFGAVTALTFSVRAAPQVKSVFLQWSGSDAADVLAAWQDWTQHTPRELWSTCKVLARPGEGVRTVLSAFWSGDGSPDNQVGALLRKTPAPSVNSPSSDSYATAMLSAAGCDGSASACIDAALTPAQRLPEAAASSILQKTLPDKAINALVDVVQSGLDVNGMVEGGVSFDALGGAVSDVDANGSAFPWRAAIADIQYTATWPFAQAAAPNRYDSFVQKERSALLPYVGASGYYNYADPSLQNYATAYWGSNLTRLQHVKKTYDPHNVFSSPQGVPT